MADIDLKTSTPDTSLPTTGFLFGADSQAASAPSVFTTQAVATTLLGSTTLSGATITADAPVLNMSQTWNNSGVTFTGLKFNVADTASTAASLLMDLHVGGSSRFGVLKDGNVYLQGGTSVHFIANSNGGGLACNNAGLNDGTYDAVYSGYGPRFSNSVTIGWAAASTVNAGGGSPDTILTRRGAANLRLGAADAAAPVAQTLSVQSVVAGTSNTAGANLTITGSQGTGTGAGGSIVFQVAPAGSSGTAQNALVDALTVNSSSTLIQKGVGYNWHYKTTTSQLLTFEANGVGIGGAVGGTGFVATAYNFASTITATPDLILARDAANTLALRNGANAQTFNIYNTTDGTNSEFGSLRWSSNRLDLVVQAAGTGTQREFALMRGATTVFNTTSAGINFPVNITTAGEIVIAASDPFRWTTRSRMTSPADGIVGFTANTAANGAALQLIEMTAPAAPAANGVRIYAVDNGSGKTQLMALFATGAAQQIAIEP